MKTKRPYIQSLKTPVLKNLRSCLRQILIEKYKDDYLNLENISGSYLKKGYSKLTPTQKRRFMYLEKEQIDLRNQFCNSILFCSLDECSLNDNEYNYSTLDMVWLPIPDNQMWICKNCYDKFYGKQSFKDILNRYSLYRIIHPD